ncbi:Carboxypeptidase regulatory-like domain-containing protein [Krasilnikoviella flava]|uniref:alpha-amylase n=2 Tax=Krasilnikoviella flava TaxID=526729 RepID=A0A1T5JZ54_9MICO|nr:Carboxypeptidase regulatory-like domain-containing protein [Krasilnikoviella flava]
MFSALAALSIAALSAVVTPTTATAATTAGWAEWDPLTGSAGDWSTTMQLPAGDFPAATVTSNSRGGGVGVISGASSWLAASTPPGETFGSSRNQPYLNLRPQADRPTTPSTTTYTFERPTPAGGWAFVLGDIDADRVRVSALGEDGQPLSADELGWQEAFNYCQGAGTPSCTDVDVPTSDPATGTLTGNATATDTNGASGWFQPSVPVTSLTIEFAWRSGFPVYQTWFASLARDITGTVTLDDGSPLEGSTVTLLGPDGTALATTTSAADGAYAFEGYTAAPGYRVELTELPGPSDDHPFGLVAVGSSVVDDVDLTDTDGVADFQARDIEPVAVSGTVLDDDGEPVPGATVTLTPVGGGEPITAVTNSRGEYLVDDVAWDVENEQPQEYEFTLSDLPEGHVVTGAPPNLTVDVGQEEASTGNDFIVQGPPAVSGSVTAGGEPVAGVVVTLGDRSTTTGADGTYTFEDVLPGDLTVTVEAPDGYTVDGPATQDVNVGTDDVTGIDFALEREVVAPPAQPVGGTVTDTDGGPVPDAEVTVTDADGAEVATATTDEDGAWTADLPDGGYTATVTPPDGYVVEGEASLPFDVVGGEVTGLDFVLAAQDATPAPSPSPDPSASPTAPLPDPGSPGDGPAASGDGPATTDGTGSLPATGADVGAAALGALLLVTAGGLLLRASRRRGTGAAES